MVWFRLSCLCRWMSFVCVGGCRFYWLLAVGFDDG